MIVCIYVNVYVYVYMCVYVCWIDWPPLHNYPLFLNNMFNCVADYVFCRSQLKPQFSDQIKTPVICFDWPNSLKNIEHGSDITYDPLRKA